jgi:hypothetical protein
MFFEKLFSELKFKNVPENIENKNKAQKIPNNFALVFSGVEIFQIKIFYCNFQILQKTQKLSGFFLS